MGNLDPELAKQLTLVLLGVSVIIAFVDIVILIRWMLYKSALYNAEQLGLNAAPVAFEPMEATVEAPLSEASEPVSLSDLPVADPDAERAEFETGDIPMEMPTAQ